MPIIIPKDLPATASLELENIFVMHDERAVSQDIRPVEIAILNLMPTKIETETQLMRLLGNTPLQVKVTLINTASYKSTHISSSHLEKFYKSLDEIKKLKFDGMIITGAPVETLPFEQVKYWDELKQIFDWADKNVTSTMYICWGAQAALYYYYGVNKHPLDQKMFGIFGNRKCVPHELLLKGMDDVINIPHSRLTGVDEATVKNSKQLTVLAEGDKVGPSIIKSNDGKRIFLMGHSEYDRDTLDKEYRRDLGKGIDINPPQNYYTDEACTQINMSWSGAANLLYYNWLNYYVYQVTPFNFTGDNPKSID